MAANHLVRVGAMGHVGPFAAVDATCYPRGSRVIVRTGRGLEIASVLAAPTATGDSEGPAEGPILRGMTVEDQLLQARLDQNRDAAYSACAALLRERELPVTLLDVEQLFDGRSLFFYFLGDLTEEVAQLTDELAETYEAKVQLQRFTDTLTAGCGPDCGTETGGGGCDGCTTCAVASACGPRK